MAHQIYYQQMNQLQNGNNLEAFDSLYKMGFTQFKLNHILLDEKKWNIQEVIEVLIDHNQLVKKFGPNYKNIA